MAMNQENYLYPCSRRACSLLSSWKTASKLAGYTLIFFSLLFFATGCAFIAMAEKASPKMEAPAYTGLPGQSIGVMVWTDRGTRADWPSLPLDLGNLVDDKLRKVAATAPELKNSTWPVQASSIVRYQNDHPGIEAAPVTYIAPKLVFSRLIYIEMQSFSTRSEVSLQMFRGNATCALEVVETTNSQSKVAYTDSTVHAFYPPKSAPEGVLNSNDAVIYRGTVDALADQIVNRLVTRDTNGE